MPMEIVVYDGSEKVKSVQLPGDVDEYDILIKSTDEVPFPPRRESGEPPEIPEIEPDEIEKANNRNAYETMVRNPNSQPAKVRRFVYERQTLTRKQVDAWAEEEGYSPHGGGLQTALVVLDNVTNEINRTGAENEDQRIVWTGN